MVRGLVSRRFSQYVIRPNYSTQEANSGQKKGGLGAWPLGLNLPAQGLLPQGFFGGGAPCAFASDPAADNGES